VHIAPQHLHGLVAGDGRHLQVAQGDTHDPAQHGVGAPVAGRDELLLLLGRQPAVAALRRGGFANVGDGVVGEPDAPFLDGDGEQV